MMELEIKDLNTRLSHSRRKTDKTQLLPKTHKELAAELNGLRVKYSELMVRLGAITSGNPSHRRRKEWADSIGGLINQVKKFKADPANHIIDGMSTAAEIEVALREHVERPPQYRVDKAVEVYFASMSHNLWDKDYPGQPITQKVCKALRAGLQYASDILRGDKPIGSLRDGIDLADIIDDAKTSTAVTSPETGGATGSQFSELQLPDAVSNQLTNPNDELAV
jgi:hypothetical protein